MAAEENKDTQEAQVRPVALADGFALGGIEGTIGRNDDGAVVFCPDRTLADDTGSIEKGRCIEVLEGSGLELIEKVLDEQGERKVKVWGLITEYRKDNYAYINYLVPAAADEQPDRPSGNAQSENEQPTEQQEQKGEDIIPEDVLSKLRGQKNAVDAGSIKMFEDQKKDRIYAGKTGVIKLDDKGRAFFSPDGLGRNVRNERYYLVKSSTLDKVLSHRKGALTADRFNVTAIATEYKERKILLLQRAVRAHSYGNLSDI